MNDTRDFDLSPVTSNIKKYPGIVLKPGVKTLEGSKYAVYGYTFDGIWPVYNFLNSEPEINERIFGSVKNLESITNEERFAGKPYDEAVKLLVNYHDPKYQEFLQISDKIDTNSNSIRRINFKTYHSVAGGVIRPVALATGDPNIFESTRIEKHYNTITINVAIGYSGQTSKEQVFNRAVILTNIIHALEENGYNVEVNAFEVSETGNELLKIIVNVKKGYSQVDYQSLYKVFCPVEFLRRVVFRLTECADVKNNWSSGYGSVSEKSLVCELLNLNEADLYFDSPRRMGIYGYSLEEDLEAAVDYLSLGDKIDVEDAKVKLLRGVQGSKLYD